MCRFGAGVSTDILLLCARSQQRSLRSRRFGARNIEQIPIRHRSRQEGEGQPDLR